MKYATQAPLIDTTFFLIYQYIYYINIQFVILISFPKTP